MKKVNPIVEAALIMLVLQVMLAVMKLPFAMGGQLFQKKMVTMASMVILTVFLVFYARYRKIRLSVFPQSFSSRYVVATIVMAVVLIATPSNYIGGMRGILVLIYGSIITPVFEELLFRGLIWNQLDCLFEQERKVYFVNAILFSVWHLGYVFPNLLSGDWFAVITKMAVGLVYGLLLGLVRLRTGNCYSTILLHGMFNTFL